MRGKGRDPRAHWRSREEDRTGLVALHMRCWRGGADPEGSPGGHQPTPSGLFGRLRVRRLIPGWASAMAWRSLAALLRHMSSAA